MAFMLETGGVVEAKYGQWQVGSDDSLKSWRFFVKEEGERGRGDNSQRSSKFSLYFFFFHFGKRVWRLIVCLGFILKYIKSYWDCIVKGYIFIHPRPPIFVHICIYFYTYLYMFLYIFVFVSIYICVYV